MLLSTHIVSDIEYIADCILMMKNGELIRQGTENEVIADVQGYVWKCVVPECEVQGLNEKYVVSNLRNSGENVELRIVSDIQPMKNAEITEATLEDAYLYYTQVLGGKNNAVV